LNVANREILGKKVKHLRRQGITPVHVFGHGIESLALQCDAKELERVLSQAGQTRLVNLNSPRKRSPGPLWFANLIETGAEANWSMLTSIRSRWRKDKVGGPCCPAWGSTCP
jgi:hypothetical protein